MRLSKVRQAVRGALALPRRFSHARRLSGIRRSGSDAPIVSFGGVLSARGLIHGGAVKLTHLRDAFECSDRSFNLLYLVSSAAPAFAEDLLKSCQKLGTPSSGIKTESRTKPGPAATWSAITSRCAASVRRRTM